MYFRPCNVIAKEVLQLTTTKAQVAFWSLHNHIFMCYIDEATLRFWFFLLLFLFVCCWGGFYVYVMVNLGVIRVGNLYCVRWSFLLKNYRVQFRRKLLNFVHVLLLHLLTNTCNCKNFWKQLEVEVWYLFVSSLDLKINSFITVAKINKKNKFRYLSWQLKCWIFFWDTYPSLLYKKRKVENVMLIWGGEVGKLDNLTILVTNQPGYSSPIAHHHG